MPNRGQDPILSPTGMPKESHTFLLWRSPLRRGGQSQKKPSGFLAMIWFGGLRFPSPASCANGDDEAIDRIHASKSLSILRVPVAELISSCKAI